MQNDLSKKAMLVRLSISQWTARKYDKKVSQEVADKHHIYLDAGRYSKVLIAREEIKKIEKTANEARTFHYENTLPWRDDGARILPASNFDTYSQKMRELRSKFEHAVTLFCDNYPDLIQDARIKLNSLFNPSDYPAVNGVRRKFDFQVTIDPMPDAADFRVTLRDEDIQEIQQDIAKRMKHVQAEAMKDLWHRLHKVVSHMADRLSKTDAVFRNSLVGNLTELVNLLPRLNLAGDVELEAMRKQVEEKLCQHDAQTLRESPKIRQETADNAHSILDAMSGYMGGDQQ